MNARSRSSRRPARCCLLVAAAAVLAACSSGTDDSMNTPAQAGAPAQPAAAASAASEAVLPATGKVLEAMDAGTYTYVHVDLGGTDVWAAGPRTEVKPGETITLPAGNPMRDFHSKTLDRTFPLVYFVNGIQTGAAVMQDPAGAVAAAHKNVSATATAVVSAAPVARLEGGQTVEEICQKRAEFAGKDVAVRGRVVKFSAGIMGANWIHIQDGTGSKGTNDLTVTTDATAALGDVVVVRGKVTVDKDFGAGYSYAVILEKAAVTKE